MISRSDAGNGSSLSAEQQLRVLLQSLPDYAFITFDLGNRITSWSAGAERILGWTEAEVRGQSGDTLFTPEDQARGAARAEQETALREGRAEDERWHLRKDGSRLWGSGVMTLLRDAGGRHLGFAKVLRDLTERRKTEEALRATEERLQRVLETDAVSVLFFEKNGTLIDANHVFLRTSGYTRAQIERRELSWRSLTPPEWRSFSEEQKKKLSATGRIGPYEKEYFQADGSRRWMVFAGRDLGDGTIAEFAIDINDRKRAEAELRDSEQRFRLLVENVREYALFQADPDGNITSWNPGAERLFGYPQNEMLGQHISRLLTPEDRDSGVLEREITRVIEGGREQDARWMVRKDGTRFWAQWITEPLDDGSGHVRGVVKVLRDETERLETEQALRASISEKETLLREVHHRVKNNLQVIVSLLSLQADQITDSAALQMFLDTQSRVRSIARIHETLYSSKDLAEIEFAQYTRVLVQDLFAFYDVPTERIARELHADDMVLNITQAIPLGLILNELVVNSLKHAFPDGRRGTVRVSLRYVNELVGPDQPLDEAPGELCVEDDGVGLPPDFDVERVESMGMYLVRILTRQLRGSLVWTSGETTRFCLRFPLSLEQSQVDL